MKLYQHVTLSLDDILLLEAVLSYFYSVVDVQGNKLHSSQYVGEFAIQLFREWLVNFFEIFNQATLFSCLSAASFTLHAIDKYYLKVLLALFNTSEHLAKAVAYKVKEYNLQNNQYVEAVSLRIFANYQTRLKAMDSLLAKMNTDSQ